LINVGQDQVSPPPVEVTITAFSDAKLSNEAPEFLMYTPPRCKRRKN